MARSYIVAPGVYINEAGYRSYIVAPGVYVNEQTSIPSNYRLWNYLDTSTAIWTRVSTTDPQLLPFLGSAFPRKSWAFDQYNDSSIWLASPTKSALLLSLLTSLGQTKPRVPWNFGLDEPQGWYGQPLSLNERNLILVNTPVASPFVNPPFRFGYDFSSFWTGKPLEAYTPYIPPPPPFSKAGDWLVIARRRLRR